MNRALTALALLAMTSSLASAQAAFETVGRIPVQAESVELHNGLAFVAAGKTLSIFDVSNPAAPKALGSHTFPEEIWAFRLQDDIAYVGVNFYGLGMLDISKPSAPALLGAFKTPGQAKTGAVFGHRALVVDHMEGIVEVDISNPSKATSRGSYFLDGYARDVVTSGPLAFAVDSPTGLYVFDLSKPGPLEPVATLQTGTGLRNVEVVPGESPRLILATGGGLLQLYDVSTPSAPVKIAPFKTPGGAQRVAFRDRVAYVADGAAGLTLVNLADPASPSVVATHKTETNARDVAVADGLVLVAVANGDVLILRDMAN